MPAIQYQPNSFPPDKRLNWKKLIPYISEAHSALARYDGILSHIVNRNILLTPFNTHEAVMSSNIEGTNTNMLEVLKFEAGTTPASAIQGNDIQEVLNYRVAMLLARKALIKEPLSQRVIKKVHNILMQGVRGAGKSPGEYRKTANWIGSPGGSIEDASYVPIGADKLLDAMSVWEKYMHQETTDQLVQAAILHAEFERLHPFLDGNGRTGRILIPLFLWKKSLIQEPVFYISPYLEAHRDEYFRRLHGTSSEDAWTQWCEFFLKTIRFQAEDYILKAREILDLYTRTKSFIPDIIRSRHAIHIIDFLFEYPIFNTKHAQNILKIPGATLRRLLQILSEKNILKILSNQRGRSPNIYNFHELMDIFDTKSKF